MMFFLGYRFVLTYDKALISILSALINLAYILINLSKITQRLLLPPRDIDPKISPIKIAQQGRFAPSFNTKQRRTSSEKYLQTIFLPWRDMYSTHSAIQLPWISAIRRQPQCRPRLRAHGEKHVLNPAVIMPK